MSIWHWTDPFHVGADVTGCCATIMRIDTMTMANITTMLNVPRA